MKKRIHLRRSYSLKISVAMAKVHTCASSGSIQSWAKQENPLFPEEVANRDQSKHVEFVVGRDWSKMKGALFVDFKYLIGIKLIVEHVLHLWNLDSIHIQFVGIFGLGGLGKRTNAKAVYNQVLRIFKGRSFLPDIREQTTRHKGLVSLQK